MIYVENTIYIGSFILFIFALAGVLNLVNINNNFAENNINGSSIQIIDPQKDIKILDDQMVKTTGKITVSGHAQNTGHYNMKYVSITVNFYDKKGNLLYSSFDGRSRITPGEIWNFEVPYRKSGTPYYYKVEIGPTM
jgi:hypothetical protein